MKNPKKPQLGALFVAAALALPAMARDPAPSFASDPAAIAFARDLEARHGLPAADTLTALQSAHPNASVLKLIRPPVSPAQRSWPRYRARFVNDRRIDAGVTFWQSHQTTLQRASQAYGVPPEIMVAIIGVETEYGRNMGGFKVLEALATLAFRYPPRAEFFRTELEQFLLLAHENGLPAPSVKGSFAGAIGIPQFMPGSQRRYAVDFDGDGKINLSASVDDAIGSVARFLEQHGWQTGQPVAVPAGDVSPVAAEALAAALEAGIRPSLSAHDLAAQGFSAAKALLPEALSIPQEAPRLTLVDLVGPEAPTEYWLGYENFYVITRYNRSSFYAMSVFQLAEAIRLQREALLAAISR